MRNILVTGGAGYIGSHAVLALLDNGYNPIIIDNLSTGDKRVIPNSVEFVEGDIEDTELIKNVLKKCDSVMHFAGSIIVSESIKDPIKYYHNNTAKSCKLIEACIESGIKNFVFSSTAAVYGEPDLPAIPENTPTLPITPYGNSKLMTEKMLIDSAKAYGLNYGILRYFNVAGADPQKRSGQISKTATHLIKIAGEAVTGKRDGISIFGNDYPTKDGTCVRDYIHVSDLIDAHMLALSYINDNNENLILNCGYKNGYSVKQVLDVVQNTANKKLNVNIAERREGDPACLVADNTKIKQILDWKPQYDNLDYIVKTALEWEEILKEKEKV